VAGPGLTACLLPLSLCLSLSLSLSLSLLARQAGVVKPSARRFRP
jgi:hypothetical protein